MTADPTGPSRLAPALRLVAAAALALGGCRLIDQRTFERTPTAPTAAQLARPDLPGKPVATVDFADPNADWRPAVHEAVRAAEAHTPNVRIILVTPVPTAQPRQKQDQFVRQGQQDAAMVAQEVQAAGVPPERITLMLRGDAGSPRRQVAIFAR